MKKVKELKKKVSRLEAKIQKDTKKLSKFKEKLKNAVKSNAGKPKVKPVSSKKQKAPAPVSKKRKKLTSDGRAKLSAAMKARWAAKKAHSILETPAGPVDNPSVPFQISQ